MTSLMSCWGFHSYEVRHQHLGSRAATGKHCTASWQYIPKLLQHPQDCPLKHIELEKPPAHYISTSVIGWLGRRILKFAKQ